MNHTSRMRPGATLEELSRCVCIQSKVFGDTGLADLQGAESGWWVFRNFAKQTRGNSRREGQCHMKVGLPICREYQVDWDGRLGLVALSSLQAGQK